MKIQSVYAREILDSKGHPTIETEVTLDDGTTAMSGVPSGASTGANEAIELRDHDLKRYNGKGVRKAIENITEIIAPEIKGKDAHDQQMLDRLLIQLDGTENKGRLGGNALIGVSMAICRAAAKSIKKPLYQYLADMSGNKMLSMPQPMILVLEGGKHGNFSTDIQEYMIVPKKATFATFGQRLQAGAEVFHALEKLLVDRGYSTGVGFEGAYCPREMRSNEEAFELIVQAIENAGYKPGDEIVIAIDAASSSFYKNGEYVLKSEGGIRLKPREWTNKVIGWTKKFPIWSLEDMHAEEDWDEWVYFNAQVGNKLQIIGDDLLTTNVKRIQKAINLKAVNSVLIKLNQIGTVTETMDALKLSQEAGYTTVISHRGGETNDDFIADLSVGTTSWQCKFGGPDRGERLAKYNRLLRIEEQLMRRV